MSLTRERLEEEGPGADSSSIVVVSPRAFARTTRFRFAVRKESTVEDSDIFAFRQAHFNSAEVTKFNVCLADWLI